MDNKRIVDLMAVPPTDHDEFWLEASLQAAIALELYTIPAYLCGMWSIINPSDPYSIAAYELIQSVVLEEMLHMGLACNMLTTLGGWPAITAPTYPGNLPGGVRPELTVQLAGLTKDVVHDVYMQIEYPQHPVPMAAETYPTIGAFYDAIAQAFQGLDPKKIKNERQLSTGIGPNPHDALFPIASIDDALKAVDTIKEQGEGTSRSPDTSPTFGSELAHYYKFGEIYNGATFIQVSDGKWDYKGDPIPFPQAWPMAPVPAGGYPQLPTAEQTALLQQFDQNFADLLSHLQAAWYVGDSNHLNTAINFMFQLGPLAQQLMQIPLPPSPQTAGNYGPDFQLPTAGTS